MMMRLFNSRLEAVKATIVKHAVESGLLSKRICGNVLRLMEDAR